MLALDLSPHSALQRQVTETLERQVMDMGTAPGGTPLSGGAGSGRGRLEKHRRSLSEERIPASVTQVSSVVSKVREIKIYSES